jgi:hypothetical protein
MRTHVRCMAFTFRKTQPSQSTVQESSDDPDIPRSHLAHHSHKPNHILG